MITPRRIRLKVRNEGNNNDSGDTTFVPASGLCPTLSPKEGDEDGAPLMPFLTKMFERATRRLCFLKTKIGIIGTIRRSISQKFDWGVPLSDSVVLSAISFGTLAEK